MSKVEELPKYGNYIDGAIVPPVSGEYLPTENPYSGKVWALIARSGEGDVAAAAAAAERALTQGEWARTSATQRGHLLWRLGDLIIAKLTPQGYQEIDRANILVPTNTMAPPAGRRVIWSHPAFANRSVYARNDKEIVCVGMKG